MHAFTIRAATINDADGIADVAVESWKWAYPGLIPAEVIEKRSDKAERAGMIRKNWTPDIAYLVAVNGEDRVIGFIRQGTSVSHPGYDAEITSLYVHPSAARQGVGKALLAAISRIFVDKGLGSLCLQTLRDNRIGRGFYEKSGGRLFHEDDWSGIPAVWYGWKDLTILA